MRLSGILPPLLTPFTEAGDVDVDRIPKLVKFMKPYVQGFFVCGTYGSGPLMNVEERKRVFETVAACVEDSYQLVAHVGTASQRDTLELAVHAVQHRAIAVTAVAPYSLRIRPGAPVAVPLAWNELAATASGAAWTAARVQRRVRGQQRDPWDEIDDLRRRQRLRNERNEG